MSILNKLKNHKRLSALIEKPSEAGFITGHLPALDILFSGKVHGGGVKIGAISEIAADSSLGKSIIGLHYLAEAYRRGMDCIVIDTERSFNYKLAMALGIDVNNIIVYDTQVIHEVNDIFGQIASETDRTTRGNVFVLLDSWGDLVSAPRMEKLAAGKGETVDMGGTTKFKNELANLIHATGVTCMVINHVYASLSPYMDPKDIPGGSRLGYNADSIVLVMSDKKYRDDDRNVLGKICNAYIKKGRDGAENSNVKYRVMTRGGLDPWYGLLDDFIESGLVFKPKPGKYSRTDIDVDKATGEVTKMFSEEECNTEEFCAPLLNDKKFCDYIEKKYHYDDTVLALQHNPKGVEADIREEDLELIDEADAESEAETARKRKKRSKSDAEEVETSDEE